MTTIEQIFTSQVNRVLNAWTTYTTAIREEPDAAQKDVWFRAMLSNFAWCTNDLNGAELADWIDEIFDVEFNCIFEDGTIEATANALLQIRQHLSTGQTDAAEAIVTQIETFARVYQPASSRVEEQRSESEGEEEMRNGGGVAGAHLVNNAPLPAVAEDAMDTDRPTRQPRTVTDDDGWTTVLSKRK